MSSAQTIALHDSPICVDLDTQCSAVLYNINSRINHAFSEALAKTTSTLALMTKAQQPKALFDDCQNKFRKQRDLLDSLILMSTLNNQTKSSLSHENLTQGTSRFTLSNAILQIPSINRLVLVRQRNQAQCGNSYRQLLRNGPLLEHLKTLPKTARVLLDISPEHILHKLNDAFINDVDTVPGKVDSQLINQVITSSFFCGYLTKIYKSIAEQLTLFFRNNSLHLQEAEPQHSNIIFADSSIEHLYENHAQPQQQSFAQICLDLVPTHGTQSSPEVYRKLILKTGKSAIEHQFSKRITQEQAARIQLKQIPLGTIFKWAGSHYDRRTQLIKLVHRDNDANTIAFHNEETKEFVRYDIDELVQALLSGEINKHTAKKFTLRSWLSPLKRFLINRIRPANREQLVPQLAHRKTAQ